MATALTLREEIQNNHESKKLSKMTHTSSNKANSVWGMTQHKHATFKHTKLE